MPGFEEQDAALADVYAAALLGAAQAAGQRDEVAEQFAELVGYLDRDAPFAAFLTSATVDDEPRRASLEKLFRGRMNDLLLNLLQVLNNRMRLYLVRTIQRQVELRMEETRNQQEVVVESALPLNDRLRELIRRVLHGQTGKEAILKERHRPELIGGIVIHLGDMQIDASVGTQINGLCKRLLERASAEVHKYRLEMMEV